MDERRGEVARATSGMVGRLAPIGRRAALTIGLGFAPVVLRAPSLCRAAAVSDYAATIKTLQTAHDREMTAYQRYVLYARAARDEKYRGIAYLFKALASSELIHAQNFNRVLSNLGVDIPEFQPPPQTVADTKSNLIDAAGRELQSIDSVYPEILKQLEAEQYRDAVTNATYAWESHKQHRGIIIRIQEYSPDHFETVATTIDEDTGSFYICAICGSTLNEIPLNKCPICGNPSSHYRKIEVFML